MITMVAIETACNTYFKRNNPDRRNSFSWIKLFYNFSRLGILFVHGVPFYSVIRYCYIFSSPKSNRIKYGFLWKDGVKFCLHLVFK